MYQVKVNDKEYKVEIKNNRVMINEGEFEMSLVQNPSGGLQVIMPDKVIFPSIEKGTDEKSFKINLKGQSLDIEIKDHYDLLLEKMGLDNMRSNAQTDLKAPMPGLVLEVLAKAGQEVKKGEALLVLEAMKMENVIKAPGDATVKDISVKPKEAVEKNQVLITFQ